MSEPALRPGLHKLADAAPLIIDADYRTIWQAAMARRRRRARAAVALSAASVLCAIAIVLPLSGVVQISSDDPSTTRQPSHHPSDQAASVTAWIASLPTGRPPSVPYRQGSWTVHDGDQSFSTRGERYNVLDKVPGGYLVEEWPSADAYEWRVGVLDVTREVTWLNGAGRSPMPLLSPDHAYAAIASDNGTTIRVYDLRRLTEVASVEADGYASPVRFVHTGLVYSVDDLTPSAYAMLWDPAHPGDDPVALGFVPQAVTGNLSRALLAVQKPCWEAIDTAAADQRSTLYRSCGLQRTYTISPDGGHALTSDFHVIDLDRGTAARFDGAPTHGIIMPVAVWEDSEHVLLRIRRHPTRGGLHEDPVIVRCSVVSLACEVSVDGYGKDLRLLDATQML
jgi:hypothetical protein